MEIQDDAALTQKNRLPREPGQPYRFAMETTSPSVEVARPAGIDASPQERRSILASLYGERSNLLSKRRLDGLTALESDFLAELERDINAWELARDDEAIRESGVLERLERLTRASAELEARMNQFRR
jgi:hypothetical protein